MGLRTLALWLYLLLTVPIVLFLLFDRGAAIETTNFHFNPDVLRPGAKTRAAWTVKTLRDPDQCRGLVHRSLIDSQGQVFAFSTIDAVIHGSIGEVHTYYYPWTIPTGLAPGPAIFRRNVDRWCNPLQRWVWPMHEVHETTFTVLPP